MGSDVVVAGHICIDVIPAFGKTDAKDMGRLFVPGKLINMGKVTVSTGGPVSNTGIALSILGIETRLMGKIGNDFFGDGVLKLLKERNLEDGMVIADGEETSYTVVIVPPGIDRIFLHNPGANNTFCAADINYDLVAQAKLFHFGYPPLMKRMYDDGGAELIKIFKRVREFGVTTSLDMSLPDVSSESGKVNWDSILRELLPYVDIFIPSVEETMFMIDRDSFDRLNSRDKGRDPLADLDTNELPPLGEKLLSYGAKIAVIKCGVKGVYIRTGDKKALEEMGKARPGDIDTWAGRELREDIFNVKVVSATGSGDSCIAGFLAAYLRGKSVEESLRVACAVGAQNVQVYDAISGIKTWEETMAMIAEQKQQKAPVAGTYWRYDDEGRVWIGGKDRSP